jgi:hypothetical protein
LTSFVRRGVRQKYVPQKPIAEFFFPSYFFNCTYSSRYPLCSASELTNARTLTPASLAHHIDLPAAFSISNFQRYFWNVAAVAECGMANAPPAVE